MNGTVLLCTDGSELSLQALRAGVDLLRPELEPLIVTVMEEADPMLVTGTGMAGGTMSVEEFDVHQQAIEDQARVALEQTRTALDLPDAEVRAIMGSPGPAICKLAEDCSAVAIVMGTRGRGGLKRAILGSVADHVVRNAPCTVIIGERSS